MEDGIHPAPNGETNGAPKDSYETGSFQQEKTEHEEVSQAPRAPETAVHKETTE